MFKLFKKKKEKKQYVSFSFETLLSNPDMIMREYDRLIKETYDKLKSIENSEENNNLIKTMKIKQCFENSFKDHLNYNFSIKQNAEGCYYFGGKNNILSKKDIKNNKKNGKNIKK